MKKFMVTTTLRLPSNGLKVFFVGGLILAGASLVGLLYSLITWSGTVLGPSILAALLSFLWLFAARAISESSFGRSLIGFDGKGIVFTAPKAEYNLRWDACRECGIMKNRRAKWCYASDHALGDKEKINFPENVEKGVMYFCYQPESWEEFMKFVPEKFKDGLNKRKTELIK